MAQAKAPSTQKRSPRTLAGTPVAAVDANRAQVLQSYEAALGLMQQGKYAKAQEQFNKMLSLAPPDLAERIRMYINACVLQISKGKATFQSHEERYDYAVSLLNQRHYEDAREHFEAIQKENSSATYVFYGMALLASMTGNPNQCLEHLSKAIQHDPLHRIQAQSDSDFQDMADDPRFTELLYPEA